VDCAPEEQGEEDLMNVLTDRLRYYTVRRLWNRLVIGVDYTLRRRRLSGYPLILIADPGNLCNLKCPLCPTGKGVPVERGKMRLETFTAAVDQLQHYIKEVHLFNYGEPLLCDQLPQMISYAHRQRMKTVISSNMNVFSEEMAQRLIASGLDQLIVSLDGISQETYETYRIGGKVSRVIENVKLLNEKKRAVKSTTPHILLQYIVFPHTMKEMHQARTLAGELGADIYFREVLLGGFPPRKNRRLAETWVCPDFQKEYDYFGEKPYIHEGPCVMLWKVAILNWDGSIFPCCWAYDSKYRYGNILEQDFKTIWNNELFQSSRGLFGRSTSASLSSPENQKALVCHECMMHGHMCNR
jgi:radical SAM protein with 4Fe4S-binding SPASM domain